MFVSLSFTILLYLYLNYSEIYSIILITSCHLYTLILAVLDTHREGLGSGAPAGVYDAGSGGGKASYGGEGGRYTVTEW